MIVMAVSLISSTTAGQIQVAQNKLDIEKNSNLAFDSDAKIIVLVQNNKQEAEEAAEKAQIKTEKEIEKIKVNQQKQTVLKVNQEHIIKAIDSMQDVMKDLADEIRESQRRRQ